MRYSRIAAWPLCVLPVFVSCVTAADFPVDFDIIDPHPTAPIGVTLGSWALQPHDWRSVGFHDSHNNLVGGIFTNSTGDVIKAIRIKVNSGFNHRFVVSASSGHDLFDTIWTTTDGKEVLFMDGLVPYNSDPDLTGTFWMQLPANNSAEIRDCDTGHGCPFTGQAYPANPPEPTGANWIKVTSARDSFNEKWRLLRENCPSKYRHVDIYGESPDGKFILYLSRGRVMLYDSEGKRVGLVAVETADASLANRIDYRNGGFALLKYGDAIAEVKLNERTAHWLK
jgi:hypothetical protein